jgi:hypothetical protein
MEAKGLIFGVDKGRGHGRSSGGAAARGDRVRVCVYDFFALRRYTHYIARWRAAQEGPIRWSGVCVRAGRERAHTGGTQRMRI